jgi:hypothetical protein
MTIASESDHPVATQPVALSAGERDNRTSG